MRSIHSHLEYVAMMDIKLMKEEGSIGLGKHAVWIPFSYH